MGIKQSRESDGLSNKLLRMLNHLNFSVIKTSDYLRSNTTKTEDNTILKFTPWILASKNEVEYIFEYVNDRKDIAELHHTLQPYIGKTIEDLKKSLVLVTDYGNGEKIRQLAQNLNLPFNHIWEI